MKYPVLLPLFSLLVMVTCESSPATTPAMQNQTKVLTTAAKYRHEQSAIPNQQSKPARKLPENISTQNACHSGASVFDLKKGQLLASGNQSSNSPNVVQWHQKVNGYAFTRNHNPHTIVYYLEPIQPSLIQAQNVPDWTQGAKPIHYTFDPSAYKQCHTGNPIHD